MPCRGRLLIGVVVACAVLAGCWESTPGRTSATGGAPSAAGPSVAVGVREPQALLARWVVAASPSGAPRPQAPFVQFSQDGAWHGSDGCNRLSGRWSVGPDGGFKATPSGSRTQMGCDYVDLDAWLELAQAAELDGDVLVLRDAKGNEIGRLRRSTA